jgi:transcription elongation GreA/GreB family factor
MADVQYLTQEGYEKLLEELKKLKEEELPKVLETLKDAIAQ